MTINIADGPDSTIYSKKVLDTSLDLCKAQSFLRSSPMIKGVLNKITTCIELSKIRCPYKKGLIHLTNCKLSTFSVPETNSDVKFKFIMSTTGKMKNNKWAQIHRLEIDGYYKGTGRKNK